MIAALDDAKVPYKVGSGGSSILVPADKVHIMRMQLAGRGIPRGDGVGFEIFDKPNFGISDFVQRANYIRAVQGELARTIGGHGGMDFIMTNRLIQLIRQGLPPDIDVYDAAALGREPGFREFRRQPSATLDHLARGIANLPHLRG